MANKSQIFIIQIQLPVMDYGSFKVKIHSFFSPPEVKGERKTNNGDFVSEYFYTETVKATVEVRFSSLFHLIKLSQVTNK